MPNYKNPLAAKKDKPKTKTYNFTAEQLQQHHREQMGESVARVLPSAYLWFSGDGVRNYFRSEYDGERVTVCEF